MDAMFRAEDFERARELAQHARETRGVCNDCKKTIGKKISHCTSCLAIIIATAMTEARIGLDEMKRIQAEGDWNSINEIDRMKDRIVKLESKLKSLGVDLEDVD